MATAPQIIDALGGTSAVAAALSLTPSTVHSWRVTNSIPAWRQATLLELALKKGVTLAATDFPPPEERVSKVRDAA